MYRHGCVAAVACAGLASLLTSCGSGAVALAPPLPVPAVSAAAAAGISAITHFGDSITCGVSSSPVDGMGYVYSNEGYAGLFDALIPRPATNRCRGGDRLADMTRQWVYPYAAADPPSGQLYTVMIGTNDATACDGTGGCAANYAASLDGALWHNADKCQRKC